MTPWISIALPLAVAILTLAVPGLSLGLALGLRALPLLAMAGPTSIAVIGSTAVVVGALDLQFDWHSVVAGSLVATAIVVVLRVVLGRRGRWPQNYGQWSRGLTVAVVGMAVAAVVIAVTAFGAIASPASIDQSYDGVFHASAVASILGGDDASSFNLYAITHTAGEIEYYPSGWHSVVAVVASLTSLPIATATFASWLAVVTILWIPGVVWLTDVLFPDVVRRGVLLTSAALASAAFAAFPYLLLDWGILYPTFLAYTGVPAGFAVLVLLIRRTPTPTLLIALLMLGAWVVSAAFSHPRSLVTLGVIILPLLAWTVGRWLARLIRNPVTRRRTIAITATVVGVGLAAFAAAIALIYRYYDLANRPISDRLNGGPATAVQGIPESLLQVILQSPIVTPAKEALPPSVLLGLLVVAGIVGVVRLKGVRWLAVSYLLIVVLYCLAAGDNSDFSKLATALWYKDKYRLMAAIPLVAVPMVAYAMTMLWSLVHRVVNGPARQVILAVASAVIALVIVLGPTLGGMTTAIGYVFTLPSGEKGGQLANTQEVELLERLPELMPEGERLIGNPWNGSVLSWSVAGVEPLFPHFTGAWDADRAAIAVQLNLLAEDDSLCPALDRLDAHYVFYSDGLMWFGDPQAAFFSGIDAARANPAIMTLVASDGGSELYRITACD